MKLAEEERESHDDKSHGDERFKSGMTPAHPGLVLREELDDVGLSANALADSGVGHGNF